jgi:hypothetical protein
LGEQVRGGYERLAQPGSGFPIDCNELWTRLHSRSSHQSLRFHGKRSIDSFRQHRFEAVCNQTVHSS